MCIGERATLSDNFHFALTAGHVVDLTRTSSAFVYNNLLTQNRDPLSRLLVGDILVNIPSNAHIKEIDHERGQPLTQLCQLAVL
jgi:hypothetical protein